ncbi:TonB-dependent receptor domain-containing protein [Thauera linaloolentis]|uniref:Putative TonB-dependent receptor n=1 Tax=Thauera linaloolentis (strain DSM 12138 / JCM 21573 / CCUG 41526 / CIP 105981 / IAM 15112 / NBRC 102519 / 47Lol) TaxID=1123367 RepID=N6Y9R2_THAL4|nr:TonB-dependent receptor [Thauera linaloolentis]ENO88255.1 putative TonB-dependent receptor [Thauera linaloolentis 47Lol = DSM 12138]MCM8566828.1 TonB-dependent receptor [Thauera linaloolentis]
MSSKLHLTPRPAFRLALHPLALGLFLAFAHGAATADQAAADGATALAPVTVSASALALGANDMSTPVSVLAGDELVRRRAATLGDSLNSEPGIAASQFGAGASRPIIRGMDGPRVKVLSDGAEIMDASSISPDHAVALEPMLTRQIEVLRGPSALAYGGGAIGGVVNVLDNRVPTAVPQNGVEGSIELRADSAARAGVGAFEITAGSGNIAIHAEGLKRDANDYRVGDDWHDGRRVDGSYNTTDSGSLGLSWVGERGYLGVAWSRQKNEYGLPGHSHEFEDCHPHGDHLHCGGHGHDHGHGDDDHDDHDHDHEHAHGVPFVKLDSKRWDLRGELFNPLPGFTRLRLRAAHTDYVHDEIEKEDGEQHISTRFRSKAHDGRIELEHAPLGGWRGTVGLQTSRRDFSANGEEAYVPPTLTKKHGLFLVEEYTTGDWRFEAGLRHEWQDIDVDSAQRDRSHRGNSVSLGAVWNFAPQYALGLSLSRTQRLPSAEELYANGIHLATSTWEVGNPDLKAETSRNIDLSLRKTEGATTFSVGVFHNRVKDYIYANTLDTHESFQLIEYAQRDASFTGIEGRLRQQLSPVFGATVFGDYVRARLDSGGDRDLPRIPAHRIGLRLDADWNNWTGEVELYRVGRQDKVAAFESETAGYNILNLGASYRGKYEGLPWLLYVKANNLTDKLAYNHSSFIKHVAPLVGRNLTVGVRLEF